MSKSAFLGSAALVALSVLSSGLTAPAAAQDTPPPAPQLRGPVEEMIVTAQRRTERLVDVPVSISAIGQADADRRSVVSIEDIARVTPNFNLTNVGTTISRVAIRGVDSDAGAGTTGIYINDIPIQVRQIGFNAFDAFPLVFDLERVEVLRGPQGTLFGAGSQGGTVRFIIPSASLDEYTGYGRVSGSYTRTGAPSFEVGQAVGGPLIDGKLGFRVSAWGNYEGGYIDRVTERQDFPGTLQTVDENANSVENYIARGELKWAPNELLEVTASFFYQKREFNDVGILWLRDEGPTSLTSSFAGAYTAPLTFSDLENGEFNNGDPTQQQGEDRFYLPSIKGDLDLGFANLIVVGSYYDRRQELADDFTTFDQVLFTGILNQITGNSPFGFSRPVLPGQRATSFDVNSQENYSVEARLESDPARFGPFKWLVGFFFSQNEQTAVQQVEDLFLGQVLQQQSADLGDPFGFPLAPDPIAAFFGIPLVDGRFIFDNLEVAEDTQYAGFVQVDYEVLDGLTLTGGFRVSRTNFNIFNEVVGPVLGPFTTDFVEQGETPVTPKFSASWKPDEDQLFYASASKGFRIGGANAAVGLPCGVTDGATPIPGTALGLLGLTDRPISFESDTLWSYEVGAKNSFFGGKLQTQAAGFHIDWSDIQQNIQLPACGFRYFDNLGSADINGFELAMSASPMEGLTLTAAIGYTRGRFAETVFATPEAEAFGAQPIVSEGDRLPGSPFTINVTAEYAFIGPFEREYYIRADWDRTGGLDARTVGTNPANGSFDPRLVLNPTTNFVNLRFGGYVNDNIELSAFATNLLGVQPELNLAFQPGSTLTRVQTFRPRTVGVRAVFRWD